MNQEILPPAYPVFSDFNPLPLDPPLSQPVALPGAAETYLLPETELPSPSDSEPQQISTAEYTQLVTEHFVDSRAKMVKWLILKTGTRPPDAEDAVQEAFAQALSITDDANIPPVLRGWLYKTAFYCLTCAWRKDKRMIPIEDMTVAYNSAISDQTEFAETRELIMTYIGMLSPKQQEAVIKYASGQAYTSIAQELGVSASTVRTNVADARKSIRKLAKVSGWLIENNQLRPLSGYFDGPDSDSL